LSFRRPFVKAKRRLLLLYISKGSSFNSFKMSKISD